MRVLVSLIALALAGCAHPVSRDLHAAARVCAERGYSYVAPAGAAFYCIHTNVADKVEAVPVASLIGKGGCPATESISAVRSTAATSTGAS